VSDCHFQGVLIVAFHHDRGEADAWNLETPDRERRFIALHHTIQGTIRGKMVSRYTDSSEASVLLGLIGDSMHRDRADPC
jgi:hypothetical protein